MKFLPVYPLALSAALVAASPAAVNNSASGAAASAINFGITHIINAASVFDINGVTFLIDPFFSPQNTSFPVPGLSKAIWSLLEPALTPEQIPPIDAVLLSHEDHPDNLDPIARMRFLDGRKVLTTPAGTDALQPRPGVQAMENWKTVSLELNGQVWNFTGTPCQHMPGGQVTGFIITGPGFGSTDGRPNAIWYSGDTLYLPELARMREQFHIKVAVLNMGAAYLISDVGEPYRIIMNGTEVARTFQDVGAEILVPLHYDSFSHFPEGKDDARRDFESSGVADHVRWVTSGQRTTIL
ncbi:Zn-dependent hydrolases of the beta-lactamase protein [Aspergillus pseudotamarii]|uniref:Zn-dependent hydrolases of the beta-lactamase protein n=1 Tax=Aspergillus pseudotamarii TaxID=132259 RepID=A0A5N6TCS4_ASPPS|nr:Zn-dependent hydrolases of the beta-lactamase protein [Aspergillus pseudotamarii]KAE8143969.1 Zn-dependent hydrolases of the beta-lactamase protein [Aspergillus pseudotamarii]